MTRRLTPDPLQVDPWTEPVRISFPKKFLYVVRQRFDLQLAAFGGFSGGLNGGVLWERMSPEYSFIPEDISIPTVGQYAVDENNNLIRTEFVNYDEVNISNPVQDVRDEQDIWICEDDGNICYEDPKKDQYVVDLGAHLDGTWVLDGSIQILETTDYLLHWFAYNQDDSPYLDGTITIQTKITAPEGDITIDGKKYKLKPKGLGTVSNYSATSPVLDRFKEQYGPLIDLPFREPVKVTIHMLYELASIEE